MALIYNQTGTLIAMTHVLLPFMILPIYAVMKSGLAGLYACRFVARRSTVDGIPCASICRRPCPASAPACMLVFILAVGYYITPGLVGGDSGALISNLIAYHIQKVAELGPRRRA